MLSPFRFAGIVVATLAIARPASAQPIAPPDSGVSIEKQVIDNGLARTVKYFVTGGSPQLRALVRRVEWAENELAIVDQLQLLKLDTVVNDRRIAAVRTSQLTQPYVPTGFVPPYFGIGHGGDVASPLQRALSGQLAYEATPQSALQLIGYLEQQQTQLDAELKALPPQEKKVVQSAIDALLPRLAAFQEMWNPAVKASAASGDPRTAPSALSSPVQVTPTAPVRVRALPTIQTPLNPLGLHQMINQQFLLVQQALTRGQ